MARPVTADPQRPCANCHETKPLEAYSPSSNGRRPSWCRDCTSTASVATRFEKTYGITLAERDIRIAIQGGKCAICGGVNPSGNALALDHNHDSGELRGMLCTACNRGLGAFRDNPAALRKAAQYLEGYSLV